jgi:acyl-CoA synthetase (NDP forming)
MEKKGFGFSGFVSLGNMAEMGFGRFIRYFCRKKDTKAIVLYIEKFNKGRRFMETCKKCSKKIYAVKAGKSAKGAEAAISHTASLATDYEIYKGAFKQAGVILCDSLLEAFEKASGKKLMPKAKNKRMKIGKRIFIVTNAGGAGALISDYLSEKGLDIVSSDGLKSPMDILGTALAQDYKNALEKLKNKDFYDSLIVILTPQSMSEIAMTAQVIADFGAETKKKIIALFLGGNSMKSANFIFQKNNIPCFNTLEEARESLSR